jgi:hypothetical protein
MTNLSYSFGSSSLKATLSAGTLSLVDYYRGKNKLNMAMLKKSGYQFLASFSSNTIEAFIRPYLPAAAQISSMYLKPIIVGSIYSLLCKIVDGSKAYVGNFILSAGSEIAASYLEAPIDQLLLPGMPGTANTAYQGSGASKVLG